MKKLLIIIVLLLVIVGAFYFNSIEANKTIGYKGIKLGESMEEVIYALGEPIRVSEIDKSNSEFKDLLIVLNKDEYKKRGGAKNFLSWRYDKTDSFGREIYGLEFDKDSKKIRYIYCVNRETEGCYIGGINTQMKEQEVVNLLGKPTIEKLLEGIDSETYTKFLAFKNHNLLIDLDKQKVIGIYIGKIQSKLENHLQKNISIKEKAIKEDVTR